MTTLIKNIVCVDGAGHVPYKADVLIKGKKILAIGSFPSYRADTVIVGNEAYCVPGFFDMNASADKYLTLFSQPAQSDFLKQGVTSMLIGNCGFSLAPLFYGSLSQFAHWGGNDHININWRSVAELLDALDHQYVTGVNVATLVGHKVIREGLMKNPDETFRSLSANELQIFRNVLTQAMHDGAFGMSTGLGYYPYQETRYHELRALADAVKNAGGIYETHLRDEKEGLVESVEETIRLSRDVGVTAVIAHLRPFLGFENKYADAVARIEGDVTHADVYFDMNPFDESVVPLDTFIPDDLRQTDRHALLEKMNDPTIAKHVLNGIPAIDAAHTIIFNTPEVPFLHGKLLSVFAQNRNLTSRAALLELMRVTKLRGAILYKNLSAPALRKALFSERSLIASNSPSFDGGMADDQKPPRATRTFTEFLASADRGGVPIEKAITKITGLPAKILGIDNRGLLALGYAADCSIITKDRDVKYVFVNGSAAVWDGAVVKNQQRAGMAIRKKSV
jgi:N-acyl-D-amino-acid deacylase